MKRHWWMTAGLLALLAGCSQKQESAPKPVVEVKLARAEIAEIPVTIEAPATVHPREQANIAARLTAPIRKLLVKKGDRLSAGQVLAELDDRDLIAQKAEAAASVADAEATLQKTTSGTLPGDVDRAQGQVATAQAAFNQAQKIYDRRKQLFEQGAIPQRELLISETDLATTRTNLEVATRSLDLLVHQSRDRDIKIAESRLDQARARLSLAETQLTFTRIVSPFAGSVTEQFMFPGDMAKPDAPMFTVANLSVAVARAQAPEKDAGAIRRGQECSFQSIDRAVGTHPGRITVINQAVDPARRTVEVWCEVPQKDESLRAGMFGSVRILTATVKGVMAPQAAVQFLEGTRAGFVMVVDDRRIAHRRDVEAGETLEGRVQIVKGLQAGEMVIVEGAYGTPDGTEVKLADDKAGGKEK